jgi:hypothetical protein
MVLEILVRLVYQVVMKDFSLAHINAKLLRIFTTDHSQD